MRLRFSILFVTALLTTEAFAANDAAILFSESAVPSSVFPNAAVTVRVRVRNLGSTPWSASQGYRLGAQDNQLQWLGYACGGYMNRLTDGRVFLCHDVAPGATHDFTFQIQAPASGTFRLAVRMVRDGVEWFGGSFAWSISATISSRNDAAVDVLGSSIPSSIAAGESKSIRVRVRNTGTTVWSAGRAYRLGSQGTNRFEWKGFSCGGYMNRPEDGRAFLCRDVAPGEIYDFEFLIAAPAAASGSLTLSVGMVQDGVEWFGGARSWSVAVSAPLRLPDVIVTGASVSPPNPAPGQLVTFTSVVRNQGGGATPPGVPIGVGYFVDGQYRTWGAVTASLQPGASLSVTTQGGPWQATSGSHTLTALVDDIDRFAEENEQNNAFSTSFLVGVAPPPPGVGELFGMNIDPANPAGYPSAQALRDIGARWVRIEWKATHGFGFFDPVIANYRASGLRVLLLVDYASVLGSPPSNASDAAWRDYISRFVTGASDIASHYGNGVDAWQIWNEPDLFAPGTGYDPGIPPHLYGVMLRDTASAIRARSTRTVVTGGLASGDASYLSRARSAVGGLFVDAVSVHPYGQRAPDDWPHSGWGFGNMSDLFDRYLAFGLPLWVTEIGTVDSSIQAAYLENVYRLAENGYAGRVDRVFWFCWSDGMVPPFGVVTATGTAKPAYWSYRAVAPP
jgi:hypothetical protein